MSGSGYALGAVTSTASSHYKVVNGTNVYQNGSSSVTTYAWYEGAVQSQVSSTPNTAQAATVHTTNFTYDGSGSLTSVHVGDGRPRTVTFVNDANGPALRRDERDGITGSGDPHEI